jgi:hypothetical protein
MRLCCQDLINQRNKRLEELVNAAAGPAMPQPHTRRSPLSRIDLREDACKIEGPGVAAVLGNGPPLGLSDISEDGTEGALAATVRLHVGFVRVWYRLWLGTGHPSARPTPVMTARKVRLPLKSLHVGVLCFGASFD